MLPHDYHRKITVHDHYYLKNEYSLAGIHLDDMHQEVPQGYKGHYSRTCDDISKLKDFKKKADYVFLKNIFDCIEFQDEKATFTLKELEDAASRGLIDKHVYALGGMSLENIHIARELRFGGVVICGDLWNRFNIHNQDDFKELITHFDKLRKAAG